MSKYSKITHRYPIQLLRCDIGDSGNSGNIGDSGASGDSVYSNERSDGGDNGDSADNSTKSRLKNHPTSTRQIDNLVFIFYLFIFIFLTNSQSFHELDKS